MINYLEKYGTPKQVRKLQQGGAAPMAPEAQGAPQGAPAAPGADLEAMLAEYAQSRDPQLAVAIADALVEMVAQQGGGAAEGGAPGGAVPMAKKGGMVPMKKGVKPVFKKKASKC